jgi:purine-binding chemotaxis protein CheW
MQIMATKKGARRKPKPSDEPNKAGTKITLPSFGLAEDILNAHGAKQADERGGWLQPAPGAAVWEPALGQDRTVMRADPAEQDLHLVTFHLDREEYGVDIGRVQEIIRVGQITGVPNAPEFIKGVINLRGRIIPVLDLRKRLSLPDEPISKSSRIMVVEAGTKVLGLLVDRVSQVLKLPPGSVDAPPGDIEESRSFVRAIGKIDTRLVMIMELDQVLAKDARQAAQHTHHLEA